MSEIQLATFIPTPIADEYIQALSGLIEEGNKTQPTPLILNARNTFATALFPGSTTRPRHLIEMVKGIRERGGTLHRFQEDTFLLLDIKETDYFRLRPEDTERFLRSASRNPANELKDFCYYSEHFRKERTTIDFCDLGFGLDYMSDQEITLTIKYLSEQLHSRSLVTAGTKPIPRFIPGSSIRQRLESKLNKVPARIFPRPLSRTFSLIKPLHPQTMLANGKSQIFLTSLTPPMLDPARG